MLKVWLHFPLAVHKEALAEALRARGLEVVDLPFAAQVGVVEADHEIPAPPPMPAVILLRDPSQAPQALKRGYRGYLYPEQGLAMLVRALQAVARGEVWAERKVVASLVGEPLPTLTPREKEVAALAAIGLSNEEIAQELGISVKTVKAHLTAVFQKLGVRKRTQLAHIRFLV
ncbi:Transcriptional regulator, LuxR [Thermus sp. CCB_US3_UF1]|uniref:LuxR family transcriptional regulator n=1 Tax=Thermus sp. CCB_US3_UF1 TaxID=1111069 RepID=UPI000238A211|nr:response regulator transcription factor [Thermus sp. CCB_US3_UF1]AEV16230.1 Transcriptional regulator, LuxR [Thermus sp. CCB_US3_UF1]